MRVPFLICALTGACLGQESRPIVRPPSKAEVYALLESSDLREIAWGVHHAREGKVEGVVPSLMVALARLRITEPSPDWEAASLQILDLLHENGVDLVHVQLVPFLASPRTRIPALGFLATAPRPDLAFFRELLTNARAHGPKVEELLAGNVLASVRAPGFAKLLLDELVFTAHVNIGKVGRRGLISGWGGGGSCTGDASPAGFPPLPWFCWWQDMGTWSMPGRNRPLSIERKLVDDGFPSGVPDDWGPAPSPIPWLADLVACPEQELAVTTSFVESLSSSEFEQSAAAVARVRKLAECEQERLATRLVAAGAMTGDEFRGARRPVTVVVRDPLKHLPDTVRLPEYAKLVRR